MFVYMNLLFVCVCVCVCLCINVYASVCKYLVVFVSGLVFSCV